MISQVNTISKLKITRGFPVSAKTGSGIKELKKALLTMVPARAVPLSYEKLLDELRSQSAKSKQSFLMAKDAGKLALTDKVRVFQIACRCTDNYIEFVVVVFIL